MLPLAFFRIIVHYLQKNSAWRIIANLTIYVATYSGFEDFHEQFPRKLKRVEPISIVYFSKNGINKYKNEIKNLQMANEITKYRSWALALRFSVRATSHLSKFLRSALRSSMPLVGAEERREQKNWKEARSAMMFCALAEGTFKKMFSNTWWDQKWSRLDQNE